MINVLIVDDSAVIRRALTEILSSSPDINIMATANDPVIALNKMSKQMPDLITLDIEMPKMDGITFLKKIMSSNPVPVVIISSLTDHNSRVGLEALKYGAIELLGKPKLDSEKAIQEFSIRIIDIVKAAASARLEKSKYKDVPNLSPSPKHSADVVLPAHSTHHPLHSDQKIIAIGASTGGTEAISKLLKQLHPDVPGIVIVQHMPEVFTKSFADRLNKESQLFVKEAENNDKVERGKVLIANGNKHMMIKNTGSNYFVQVMDGPLVNRHRPSVDVLFRSVANEVGKNALGILLTGMGADGAQGLLEMKNAGANTIAQNEESSVVFGMPKEAIRIGAATNILSLDEMTEIIQRLK